MLKERISADYIDALKNKLLVEKNLLSVIKGYIQNEEKNTGTVTDADIVAYITKMKKSLSDQRIIDHPTVNAVVRAEIEVLDRYLPTQMSEAEVTAKIQELIAERDCNIAEVMREFATLPADRKMVSEIYHSLKKVGS